MKKEKETEKKPIYKKWWFWVIIVLLVVSAFGSKKKQNEPGTAETTQAAAVQTTSAAQTTEVVPAETTVPATTAAVTTEAPETEATTEAESVQGSGVFSDVSVSSVHNDTTGKWKVAVISKNIEIEKYALEYYNTFFESDDEIHAIVNFANNTTTAIQSFGDFLEVRIGEYVDGEEHDADKLFGGMLLKKYWVYKDSGDIEEIGPDD